MNVRTRFAPSPTGYLHLGGLRTALYTYLFTKKNNGKFILRIEDTYQERFVPGATQVIYDTLRDCGLLWDEGPDVGGDYGPYIQSERKDMYLPYAKELVAKGKAYYCFCTKEELAERRAAAEAEEAEAPKEKDFTDFFNWDSIRVLDRAVLEGDLAGAKAGDHFQFLRQGYFCADSRDSKPGHLVFNRSVSLKDSYKPQ